MPVPSPRSAFLILACRAVALHPLKVGLDEEQRAENQALFLVRHAPMIHLVGELAELRIQGFQIVSGLQANP